MELENLKLITSDFLNTYGYHGKGVDEFTVRFSRPTGLGFSDDLFVYFHEKGDEEFLEQRLDTLTKKLKKSQISKDFERKFFLSNTALGLVPKSVTDAGFK